MSYQVLALKYRPQTFQDVVGQTHVTTTLSNAIAGGRVAHAILFAGPRGTGKTTIARILAKSMNCENGPTPTPCNVCRSCIGITAGQAVDVFEIDGASNNSVDQVRELRENVTYMPSVSPRKIYIIDEVHMLSTAAFNALLKTLEEPPDHVMFIFATTEVHKIPVTILSRCQRHDLGRISLSSISAHLIKLSRLEGYTLSQESCDLIAQEGDGSMRDSLSLLDRIMSSSPDKEISHKNILRDLGIIDKELLFDISQAVIQGNGAVVLEAIEKAHDMGLDLKKFYSEIIRHFRNLAVVKICKAGSVPGDISDHDHKRMASLIQGLSQIYLSQAMNLLLTEESLVKFSSHTKTAVEMVLLKLVQTGPGQDVDTMIQKLDLLAKQIQGATGAQAVVETQVHIPASQVHQQPPITQPVEQMHQQPPMAPSVEQMHQQPPMVPPVEEMHQQPPMAPPVEQMHQQPPMAPPVEQMHQQPPMAPPVEQMHQQPPVPPSPENWSDFLKELSKKLPFVSAILAKSRLVELSETDLKVQLIGSAAFDMKRIKAKRGDLEQFSQKFFGKKITINILPAQNSQNQTASGGKSPARLKQEALSHPLVAQAIELFNGSVVDIQFKN